MSPKLDKLKIAPVRSGKLLCSPWSFWAQGDDIYAASTALLSAGGAKISLHKSGKWLLQIGTVRRTLIPKYSRGDHWVAALHVHFLIPADPIFLPEIIGPKVLAVEVPQGETLRIDTYVNLEPNFSVDGNVDTSGLLDAQAKPGVPLSFLYACPLRSHGYFFAMYTVLPSTPEEQERMRSVRAQASSIAVREMVWQGARSEHGNFVVVVPDSTNFRGKLVSNAVKEVMRRQ